MKLKGKFILRFFLVITLLFLITVAIINFRYSNYTEELSMKITHLYATQIAEKVRTELMGDMKVIETMKGIVEYYSDDTVKLNSILKPLLISVLKTNERFLAVWISLELSYLENNPTITHGRKRMVVKYSAGKPVVLIDTADLEQENTEGWYYYAKVGRYNAIITDPYFYTYVGEQDTGQYYLETSLGLSLFDKNGRFIGLIGIDVTLKSYQELVNIITPFQGSYTFIVSTNGYIVAHPNEKYLGADIYKAYPFLRDLFVKDSISEGKPAVFKVRDPRTQQTYLFSLAPIFVADPTLPWSLVYVVPVETIFKQNRNILAVTIVSAVISIFLILLVTYLFIKNITERITKVSEVLHNLSLGIIDEKMKLKVEGEDEIDIMYKAVNELIDSLKRTVEFANEIGSGNLEAFYELKDENDVLGKALIEMKMSLKRAKQEEEKRLIESEKLAWTQTGITEINEILRLQVEDIEKLAFEVIKFIVKYLKANQGGFYLIDETNGKKIIKLLVAYAYDRKKLLEAEFELGEGLVGRAIKEKTIVHIKDLPQGYVYVTSGLGGETPKNLIIVPLIFENEVYGAIEILSFKEFEKHQIEFLEQAAYRIASTVSNIIKNIQTAELLKQFQQQTKLIEQKEKTLERRFKELEEIRKQLELEKQQYAKFIEAIDKVVTIIEYNSDFYVVKVNEKFLAVLNLKEPSKVLGKKIDELLIESKENPKWFEKFLEDLKAGKIRKKVSVYKFDTREVYLDETYIPFMDEDGNLEKVICFGIDVTKLKLKEKSE